MPAKRNNASTLLQKVSSQLQGERIPVKAKDEDELATYLNNLTQKVQQKKVAAFEDYGDGSLSSGVDGKTSASANDNNSSSGHASAQAPASRFLKKKPALNVTASKGEHQVNAKRSKTSTLPAHRKGKIDASTGKDSGPRQVLSVDKELKSNTKGYDVGWRPGSTDTLHKEGNKFQTSQASLADGDQLTLRASSSQLINISHSCKDESHHRSGSKHKDEIVRTLGSRVVPSDQDSLSEFIQGLSMSESSARRPQNLIARKQQKWKKKPSSAVSHSPSPVLGSRSPSPFKRSNSPYGKLSRSVSQDTEAADLMDSEIMENKRGSYNSDDKSEKLNLMDVASLLPSSSPQGNRRYAEKYSVIEAHTSGKAPRQNLRASSATTVKLKGNERTSSAKKSESRSSLFDAFDLHMADELLPSHKGVELDISEESEIKTESSDRQRRTRQRHHNEPGNSRSADVQRKTPSLEKSSPETSVSEVIAPGNVIGRRNFDTDKTDVEYSDSFDSESRTVTQSASLKPKDRKSMSQNSSNRRKDHKVVMEEMLVDVSVADAKDGSRRWNTTHMDVRVSTPYGLQYVDPSPIATQVVSADALEALTAYSPNMLALQEMMKAQLQLVRNFVDIQQRIYKSCMDGLSYDYKYTTLEDTKEYISRNRKPRMTFKEELQLVKEE